MNYELHVIEGPLKGLSFVIEGTSILVGRSKRNDVQLPDTSVSGKHIKLMRNNGTFLLEDLKSVNGTFVNGTRISPGVIASFEEGDHVRLGHTLLTLRKQVRSTDREHHSLLPGNRRERRLNERKDVAFIIHIAKLFAGKTLGIQETLDRALDQLLSFLEGFDRALVLIHLPNQDIIKTIAMRSKLPDHNTTVQYSHPVVQRAIHSSNTVCLSSGGGAKDPGDLQSTQTLSVVCAPLFKGSKPRGALYIDAVRTQRDIQRRDMVILECICDLLSSYFQKLQF